MSARQGTAINTNDMKRAGNDNQIRIKIIIIRRTIRRIRSSCALTAAAAFTALGLLAGCAQTAAPSAPGSEEQAAEAGAVQAAEETAPEGAEAAAPSEEAATEAAEAEEALEAAQEASTESAQETPEIDEQVLSTEFTIRVGMLKNPGAFGLVAVMDAQEMEGEAETEETQEQPDQPEADPNFILYDSMQELADQFRQEELDAAILPANVAAVLYQQTEGGVLAADLCTLNSLTCVTGSEEIHSVKDFAGRTVVMTGQGTAAEYSLKYLLKLCGIEDCTILFASDGLEIAGLLRADPAGTIALLPEPFATVTVIGNDAVKPAFALTDEWEALAGGRMPGNVLAVRKSYAEENGEELAKLLSAHEAGTLAALADPEETARRIARYGMIDKATVAREVLPHCRLVCASGEEMKNVLSGYLEALYSVNESSVGGELPGDDFYYGK